MAAIGSIIETGVDKLVKLVKERAKISMEDAAKELGVSSTVIEEWADFLEEEGIISIDYKLTKPFLVERKLTKTEITKKVKEFTDKKEVFIRKAEGTVGFLEKEATKLKSAKKEFDELKKESGLKIGAIRTEVAELEKYQQLKTNLDQQINQQKIEVQEKISEMTQKILREQKKYQEILTETKKEAEDLKKEKEVALSIKESEKLLKERLTSLKLMTNKIEKKIGSEELAIENSEEHIEKLKNLADLTRQNLRMEKNGLQSLLNKSKEQKKKIQEVQDQIEKRMIEEEKKFSIAKKSSEEFKKFFDKKMRVVNLIDKVNKDRDDLEKQLIGLIKKAKSLDLTSKAVDIGKQMLDLEKKFKDVDKKKNIFVQEFKKLNIIFKK